MSKVMAAIMGGGAAAKELSKQTFFSISWTELEESTIKNKEFHQGLNPAMFELWSQAEKAGYSRHDMGAALIMYGIGAIANSRDEK
jgi:hypothetical protein